LKNKIDEIEAKLGSHEKDASEKVKAATTAKLEAEQ